MTIDEYIAKIKEFVVVPGEHLEAYLTTLLASEAGECVGLYGKKLRGDFDAKSSDPYERLVHEMRYKNKMLLELGDCIFALALISDFYKWELKGPDEYMDDEYFILRNFIQSAASSICAAPVAACMYLSDCFVFLKTAVNFYGFTLEQVMQANIDKLTARKEKGTIMGSGSDR